MKTKSILASACLALALTFAGCATTSPDQIARIASGSKTAAYIGTAEYLLVKPESRPAFLTARDELVVLENAAVLDVATLLAIVNRLPVKELKSPQAVIIITGASLILSDVAGSIPLDQVNNLRPVVTAIRQGIELGLGLPAGPGPAPVLPKTGAFRPSSAAFEPKMF